MTAKEQAQETTKPEGNSPERNPPKEEEINNEGIEGIERFPHPSKAHRKPNALAVPGIRNMEMLPSPLGMFGRISQKFTC